MFIGENSDLFSGMMYNDYKAPAGFCFDVLCKDDPIIDNKHSRDYNVDKRARFIFSIYKMINFYKIKYIE